MFLDRDGTMIEDVGYLHRVEDVAFYPWTVDVIRALNRAGLLVVVVTNQSAIARGLMTEDTLGRIHARISQTLEAGAAAISAYYYCPHHPDGSVPAYAVRCECRKPAPGLINRAEHDLGIDLRRSFMVGDRWRDVALARATGMAAVLVRTGGGSTEEASPPAGLTADAIVDNLAAAASWILTHR